MRTFGVEEELLLVDERGIATPVAPLALADAPAWSVGRLGAEIQQEMIETQTCPRLGSDDLFADIVEGRTLADTLARRHGARAVAVAMSPLPLQPHATPDPRYDQMMARYGLTARGTLVCGCHVHVAIQSREEGVAVLDRIRIWLPALLALSANSPFVGGVDTGHASYRFIAWHQWQSAGPTDIFGSVEAYDRFERLLVETGVIIDKGMLYLDARVSHKQPTVEVRVADVCLDARDTVVLAALVRALVDTAADEWRSGVPPFNTPSAALRLAEWQAALTGVGGMLPHPVSGREGTAAAAIDALLMHCAGALQANGDLQLVRRGVLRILQSGGGAGRQRAALERRGRMRDVVTEAIAATHDVGEEGDDRFVA